MPKGARAQIWTDPKLWLPILVYLVSGVSAIAVAREKITRLSAEVAILSGHVETNRVRYEELIRDIDRRLSRIEGRLEEDREP